MTFTSLRALVLALLCGLGLAACNTMEGAGEDLGAAGQAVEGTAEEAKPY
jgi:predicted small secreted protein